MSNNQQIVMNRIKVTLVEKQKTNRWLAEQMGKSENTISRWCSNKSQPSIAQLIKIASLLNIDAKIISKHTGSITNITEETAISETMLPM